MLFFHFYDEPNLTIMLSTPESAFWVPIARIRVWVLPNFVEKVDFIACVVRISTANQKCEKTFWARLRTNFERRARVDLGFRIGDRVGLVVGRYRYRAFSRGVNGVGENEVFPKRLLSPAFERRSFAAVKTH